MRRNHTANAFAVLDSLSFEICLAGSMAKRYARKKVCRYQCRNTNGSYKCLCPPGYVSDPSRECRDVNECEGGRDDKLLINHFANCKYIFICLVKNG